MKYKELSKLYYMDSSSSRDAKHREEYLRRIAADSTFKLDFITPQGELYIAVPKELTALTEKILCMEREVSTLINSLPLLASGAVMRGLVLDEVVSSNAIEAIYSTRRQVKDALEVGEGSSSEARRFREFAMLYLELAEGPVDAPVTPEDIRAIYDKVTQGEIPADKLPDGKLFRAQGVNIVQGGVRVIHAGLEPEVKIIDAIKKMIEISQRESLPALYRALATHYLFEYAHPFYDGNGRTGRYLLSLYLCSVLSPATALSVSRTIVENKGTYYRAFKTAEKPLNCGELTFFVYEMLSLVREAQINLLERLGQACDAYAKARLIIQDVAEAKTLKEQEAEVVSLLVQYEVFGMLGDATLGDIADVLGVKEQMARKYVAVLETKGIVVKCRKRNPVSFALTDEFKEAYGILSVL